MNLVPRPVGLYHVHLPVALALLVFSGLFWTAGARASVFIDGTRYHYLDDDQMISMRYARNLADGHGPVWNVGGERVEGYTNFGWVVMMAAVHRLGAPDATAALWVRAINWALGCAVLLLTARLLLLLGVQGGLPALAALGSLALGSDLLFWAINGFETTLLTVCFLWALLRALRDGEQGRFRAVTCLLAGLLPVVRADAVDLTMAVVVTAVALGARRRWWLVVLAALPLAVHEAFRLNYYGEWFPNTYYLKVAGRAGLFLLGLGNLKGFLATYTVALAFAAAVSIASSDRRFRVLGGLLGFGFARILFVGPDIFPGFRFLAPYVPVLLAVAAAAIVELSQGQPILGGMMASLLVLATVFNAGVSGRAGLRMLLSLNGGPYVNTVAGVLLRRHAMPDSRIVVAAAGCLPYFSRLGAIDLLGKSDRHVARLPPATTRGTGHNRFDVEWSLRSRPDFVASFGSHALAWQAEAVLRLVESSPTRDYGAALLLNPTFVQEYLPHPVPIPLLLDQNAVFVHERSPERARLEAWRAPAVHRP